MTLTVLQLLPDLDVGGVERGTVEIAQALIRAGHRAIVVSAPGRLVKELDDCGAEHIAMPIGKKSLFTLLCISKLRKLIIEKHVDVVHARSRLPAWIGWLAIKPLEASVRPRWVTTVHGPYSVNKYSEIMLSGEKVIAISQFIRNYIVDNYPEVDRSKVGIIHRGVDHTCFNRAYRPSDKWLAEWKKSPYFTQGQQILLFPGRLTRWKGQHSFIKLVEKLQHLESPPIALIAGSQTDTKSNYETELREQVRQRGLDSLVHFMGQRNDLQDLFSVADISFSLPEIPEAFGRTTLEALSVGTPVIGYRQGGTGEILEQLFPQGLVEDGDIDGVAKKTAEFLLSPPSVKDNTKMTLAQMQIATLEVYKSLASR